MTQHDDTNRQFAFGGFTPNDRTALIELFEDDDGQPFVHVKAFIPFHNAFLEQFPEGEGDFPGGHFEVLHDEAEEPAVVFMQVAYTLPFAVLLGAGIGTALNASGQKDELLAATQIFNGKNAKSDSLAKLIQVMEDNNDAND